MVALFIFTDLYDRKSTFSSQIVPGIYQDLEMYPPTWFSAITCAIWLRLIFRGRGSAWFFGAHLFFFMPGDGFGRPVSDFWTWGQHFGPKTFLGSKMGPEKYSFVRE